MGVRQHGLLMEERLVLSGCSVSVYAEWHAAINLLRACAK